MADEKESVDDNAAQLKKAQADHEAKHDVVEADDLEQQAATGPVIVRQHTNWFKELIHKYWKHKKVTIPVTLVLVACLFVVPAIRYSLVGLILKKEYIVTVVDSSAKTPISDATVRIGDMESKTDAKGIARVTAPVGQYEAIVTKQYYRQASASITVKILGDARASSVALEATGRPVPVTVVDSISLKGVAGATVTVLDTKAKTDKSGKATIVLPTRAASYKVAITLNGYNQAESNVTLTTKSIPQNTFKITAKGTIYFLSKRTGKIDVMKSDLDGKHAKVVLAGTGSEDDSDTVMLASTDWKYLAFKSRREGSKAKMHLIDASKDDKMVTFDEGAASFTPIGWSGDTFFYRVYRENKNVWDDKPDAIKAYNAANGQLSTVDETRAAGSAYYDYERNVLSSAYLVESELIYAKTWEGANYLNGKTITVHSVNAKTLSKKEIGSIRVPDAQTSYTSVELKVYEPQSVILRFGYTSPAAYYEYENGKFQKSADITDTEFYQKQYPTYLVSPDGERTFWSDARDGKNVLFVGNAGGKSEKQVAQLASFQTYGWYGENYLLVSKNSSELFIMPVSGVDAESKLLKITDYHKPAYSFTGYGGGYGGI